MSVPPAPPLLLASTSPQRRAILHQLGIPFDVAAPRYEEHDPPEGDAEALRRGVELIHKQFKDALSKLGLESFTRPKSFHLKLA